MNKPDKIRIKLAKEEMAKRKECYIVIHKVDLIKDKLEDILSNATSSQYGELHSSCN